MKFGIVINSRLSSSRIPKKALKLINGIPVIEHLIKRLEKTGIHIVVAVPLDELNEYRFLTKFSSVSIYGSIFDKDPLARMIEVAEEYKFDYVIRITHDKIFIDTELMLSIISEYFTGPTFYDYIYLNNSVPGVGFEIISKDALSLAANRFKNVEFIGYAIREVTTNIKCIELEAPTRGVRLLIDYPQDVSLMQVIFSQLGNECTLNEVFSYLISNFELKLINRLPKVTVYTCAYNAEKWLSKAIDSVMAQVGFPIEYILIDDFSSDRTPEIMARAASIYPQAIKFIRNDMNIGLSSSCNRALSEARGEYIIRLDADDTFIGTNALHSLVYYAQNKKLEIVYPNHYEVYEDGSCIEIEGSVNHHAGGALFNRAALNYVKFTEGLRGHDSLDIFLRARDYLKIGYLEKPIFNYFQHPKSLSKTDLESREKIKRKLIGEDEC